MQLSELFPFIIRDPNQWSLLVPRNRYWGLHPPPAPLEKVIDDGLMAVQRAIFLKKAGVESAVDEKFLLNPPSRADLLEIAVKNMSRVYSSDFHERCIFGTKVELNEAKRSVKEQHILGLGVTPVTSPVTTFCPVVTGRDHCLWQPVSKFHGWCHGRDHRPWPLTSKSSRAVSRP